MFTTPLLIIPQTANDPNSHQQVSGKPPAEPRSGENCCYSSAALWESTCAERTKPSKGRVPSASFHLSHILENVSSSVKTESSGGFQGWGRR